MKKITNSQANTLGDWAYLAIEKHFNKTIRYEKDVLQDQDPENLHQMRVGMRRLRSAATGFAPALALPKPAQEKKIAKIARTLGELRDLDVLIDGLTTHYAPNLPKKERATLDAGLIKLAKQRRTIFKKIKKTLKHDKYIGFKESLMQWLQDPQYQPMAVMDIYEVLPDLLSPEVNRLFLQPGWMVGANFSPEKPIFSLEMDPQKVEQELAERGTNLHNLRKQAKRVRYQMSLFTDFYGSDYQEYLADMKIIQDVLGEIQDTEVLGAIVTDILGQEISQVMPTLAQQLTETRYELWQEWAPLYDRYMNSETRQAFRTALLHPGSATPTVPTVDDRTPDENSEKTVTEETVDSPVAENERSSLEENPDAEKPNKSKKKNKKNDPSN